ncbi:CMGC/SRPK protein kinase [Arthroderma uncinatum]|uniref:CMGC/SRPK protein kinase n=1 Tax=Arthroderma uncinatum TaxID=74035 RepID=UPI00144A4F02|nr:CMGC/SRPK protein kinase [Arthroderma uncinatum]KAF3482748.1 CMGC/SRPK protein kinase [Arthroderma uncinatum]
MLRRLKSFASEDHPGLDFTRLADDIFETKGPTGQHYCIVSKPQGTSVRTLQELCPDAKFPKLLVKSLVYHLLFSLNWLHTTCGVVHTDISPQNILMSLLGDTTSLKDLEEQESRDPSVPVITKDSNGAVSSVVYETRPPKLGYSGHPILTDFGQMRQFDECVHKDWWMSDLYRAPEVLMKLPWSFPIDIWSIGVLTLELMEGRNLFDPVDRVNNQYVIPLALAQYIGYLGEPPRAMLAQSPRLYAYFDEDVYTHTSETTTGEYIGGAPIPQTSLEEFVTVIPPGDEKDKFLQFIRKMLTWDPEERKPSIELLTDEWLTTPGTEADLDELR